MKHRPVSRAVTRSSAGSGKSEIQAGSLKFKSRLNGTQCFQRLATTAIFLRKELGWPGAMPRRWASLTRDTLWYNTARTVQRKT